MNLSNMKLTTSLDQTIKQMKEILPIGTSFDICTRDLVFNTTKAYWVGVSSFCQSGLLLEILSDLQKIMIYKNEDFTTIESLIANRIGHIQTVITNDMQQIIRDILSGCSVLFIDEIGRAHV